MLLPPSLGLGSLGCVESIPSVGRVPLGLLGGAASLWEGIQSDADARDRQKAARWDLERHTKDSTWRRRNKAKNQSMAGLRVEEDGSGAGGTEVLVV